MDYLAIFYVINIIILHQLRLSKSIVTPINPHSEQLTSPSWEHGLKEATYRVFAKEGWLQPGLKDELSIAPILGESNPVVPFGDISVLARGQLYYEHGNLIFVKDKNLYDCENCESTTPAKRYGKIVLLWSVRRLRHRRHVENFRYEVEYKISPVKNGEYVKSNGEFNYDIPSHIFLLNQDIKKEYNPAYSKSGLAYLNNRHYLPPYTTTTSVYYYTKRNERFTTTERKKSKLEEEIELYNQLLNSLKNTRKSTTVKITTTQTKTSTTTKPITITQTSTIEAISPTVTTETTQKTRTTVKPASTTPKPTTTRRTIPTKEDFYEIFQTKTMKPTTQKSTVTEQIQTPEYVATGTEGYTIYITPITPMKEVIKQVDVTINIPPINEPNATSNYEKTTLNEVTNQLQSNIEASTYSTSTIGEVNMTLDYPITSPSGEELVSVEINLMNKPPILETTTTTVTNQTSIPKVITPSTAHHIQYSTPLNDLSTTLNDTISISTPKKIKTDIKETSIDKYDISTLSNTISETTLTSKTTEAETLVITSTFEMPLLVLNKTEIFNNGISTTKYDASTLKDIPLTSSSETPLLTFNVVSSTSTVTSTHRKPELSMKETLKTSSTKTPMVQKDVLSTIFDAPIKFRKRPASKQKAKTSLHKPTTIQTTFSYDTTEPLLDKEVTPTMQTVPTVTSTPTEITTTTQKSANDKYPFNDGTTTSTYEETTPLIETTTTNVEIQSSLLKPTVEVEQPKLGTPKFRKRLKIKYNTTFRPTTEESSLLTTSTRRTTKKPKFTRPSKRTFPTKPNFSKNRLKTVTTQKNLLYSTTKRVKFNSKDTVKDGITTNTPIIRLTTPILAMSFVQDGQEILDDIFGKTSITTTKTTTRGFKPRQNAEIDELFNKLKLGKYNSKKRIKNNTEITTTSKKAEEVTESTTESFKNLKIIFSGFYEASTSEPTTEETSTVESTEFVTTLRREVPTEETTEYEATTVKSNDVKLETTTENVNAILDNLVLSVLNNARAVRYLNKKKRHLRKKKRLVKIRNKSQQ